MSGMLRRLALAVAVVLTTAAPALADEDFLKTFQSDVYAGQTLAAEAAARARLATAPNDMQARFGLGTAQFLEAVEHLVQRLHHYGLRSAYRSGSFAMGVGMLPILRLPVPDNPNPEPITYEALRGVLADFVDDLGIAETSLGQVHGDVKLPLSLGQIRVDFDSDGQATEAEKLTGIIATVAALRQEPSNFDWLDVSFDGSDVLWLRAYCNLLMAIADLPLGYDFHEAYDTTFRGVFPSGVFPPSKVADNDRLIEEQWAKLHGQFPQGDPKALADWLKTDEGKLVWEQWRDLESKRSAAGLLDLLAFIHQMRWPVVEADRLKDMLGHLEQMVALSRASWTGILAETDDDHEWIPNPNQHGVLPGMRITPDLVSGWMGLLDQLDGIFAGKILLPHPRFTQGINLRRMLLEPGVFDPVMMAQGSGVAAYLEDGPMTDPRVWARLMQLVQGNFLGYFLWIN